MRKEKLKHNEMVRTFKEFFLNILCFCVLILVAYQNKGKNSFAYQKNQKQMLGYSEITKNISNVNLTIFNYFFKSFLK